MSVRAVLFSERLRSLRSSLLVAIHRRSQARAQMVATDLESLAALSATTALEHAARIAEHHRSHAIANEIRALKP